MQSPDRAHERNVIGAAGLLVGDLVRGAVEDATGAQGATAAALTALLGWADGRHVDALALGLRLSQSRTVRVVDTLERDGLVRRRSDPADRRRTLVDLTPAGRRLATQAVARRTGALEQVLASLTAEETAVLARVAEAVVLAGATDRHEARAICRMCDVDGCGHAAGRCPSTLGADRAEAT
jgi:MarR family transcriptional repressor of emrRAB